MFSVWRMPVPFLSCGGSWLGCDVVPVMGTLFQSRGWLPIVPEAPGYSRHPTSILAMQLLTMVNCLIICALMKKTLTMTKPYGLIKPFRGKLQSYKLQATSYKIHTVCVLDTLKGLSPVCTSIWSFNLDALEHTTLQSGCGHTWRLPSYTVPRPPVGTNYHNNISSVTVCAILHHIACKTLYLILSAENLVYELQRRKYKTWTSLWIQPDLSPALCHWGDFTIGRHLHFGPEKFHTNDIILSRIWPETLGAFHLVKISGISGSAVNGTRFIGSSHWKIPRKSGKSK